MTGSPETCSTPGIWTPDTCSLGYPADVTSDDWCMLAPGTWFPDTPIPDTRKRGSSPDVRKQITSREVNRSGAATIHTPVHVVASVCHRISGRTVFTEPEQVLLAVVPSNLFRQPKHACGALRSGNGALSGTILVIQRWASVTAVLPRDETACSAGPSRFRSLSRFLRRASIAKPTTKLAITTFTE